MITGAHSVLYTRDADADRAFFRDVLGLDHIDMGGGWLIFALPPAEVAFHPSDRNGPQELYLICDDVAEVVTKLAEHGIATTPVSDEGWGLVIQATLPGGGELGIYQPRHPRPNAPAAPRAANARNPRSAKSRARSTPARPAKKKSTTRGGARKKATARTATAKRSSEKPAKARSAGRAQKPSASRAAAKKTVKRRTGR